MSPPVVDPASTDTQIVLTWPTLSGALATGNSPIISYNLYWDAGTGTPNIELTDSLITSFTVLSVVGGTNYQFKVRARNIYGYGDFSNVLIASPSDVPDKMSIPTVELSLTDVKFTWILPDSHSSAIT